MSKKRILNDEQYTKSELWLKDAASKMNDPLSTHEERKRLHSIFVITSELMGDYMTAKDCMDDQTRARYIDQSLTTQEWLDEYWLAMNTD